MYTNKILEALKGKYHMKWLLLMFLIGCSKHIYIAHDDAECKISLTTNCGTTLLECNNGNDYVCEQNVIVKEIK
jgi:hypothetical protein